MRPFNNKWNQAFVKTLKDLKTCLLLTSVCRLSSELLVDTHTTEKTRLLLLASLFPCRIYIYASGLNSGQWR